jgi:beta-galactosidase
MVPKGVVYLEDSEQFGASLSYDMMRQDMQAIKDMGVNVIRFADGVPHPYLLYLCDELGLMAWIDASIGTPPSSLFSDEGYVRRSLDRLRFTIEEGGVHTCVTAYGISAPVSGSDDGTLKALGRMRALIDSLDYRPFYCSSHDWSQQLRKLVDIAGFSTFDLEADKVRTMIASVREDLAGALPLVVLSYGKFVQLGNHNGYSDPISIEAQAKYISDVYSVLQQAGVGGIFWSFNDYRTDRPILTVNNDQQYLATSGLFGLDREQRQGAQMLGNLYTDQKTPDVLIGDYSPPSTVLFIIVGIVCAFVFLLLINNSRRFRENVSRALLRPFNFFADIRDQRILSSVQTTMLGVVIAATFAVIIASLAYYYRMNEAFDTITGTMIASDGLKELLNYITWRPALSVLVFTVLFFLLLMFVAVVIRLCAVFVRNRIFFTDAYSIAVWAALPMLLLIPIAMSLYRILEAPGTSTAVFILMIVVLLWLLYRVLRGMSVVFDIRPTSVYGYAVLGIVVFMALLYVTSGSTSATLSYLSDGIEMYSGG